MKHVLIIHNVEDYQTWKKKFDDASTIRKQAGEISYQVLCFDEEANKIVHLSLWNSHENARHFFESPKLNQIRFEAGVKNPDFFYLNELDKGIL